MLKSETRVTGFLLVSASGGAGISQKGSLRFRSRGWFYQPSKAANRRTLQPGEQSPQPGPGYPAGTMTKPAASRLARHLRRLGHRVQVHRHRAPGRGLVFYAVERLGR
jgi:hypothetical protein